eukprot:195691-Prorocentrum_minimum.AAC.1
MWHSSRSSLSPARHCAEPRSTPPLRFSGFSAHSVCEGGGKAKGVRRGSRGGQEGRQGGRVVVRLCGSDWQRGALRLGYKG